MRRLSPEEAALWARVMASTRPIRPAPTPSAPTRVLPPAPQPIVALPKPKGRVPDWSFEAKAPAAGPATIAPRPGATLDGGWDKRLSRGIVMPDVTVDLHGHTLHSAHDLLEDALDRALARGDRVILLVTGKPPRPESERPHARGAIRAAVGDWLAGSRFAGQIAAVRNAHPRHGGSGALYIVLRRGREPKS
jgi:DNA-nicking Smr family endonuclease